MALAEPTRLRMQINHREVEFPEGVSVLRAAELNGVKIPSLCSHKDLSPFGSCRMCMVEIEGMRGYPLACDTKAAAGMKVLTHTARLGELRTEILKLILSEHPSSCFLCDESEECSAYQGTIRKAGVSTGCRFCPNDRQCELQDLVNELGIKELGYPVYYHGYEPEQGDPFYDRDYNICILCGRCVRMCQEVRGTAVLAFTWRGRKAKIGPAFGRSHIEAGCEFCGACVDVCPTGALADKASKWDGKPDGFQVSTCPFCAVGCQVEIAHKDGRLSSARAHGDPEVNDGQLCVKGRFCMPEVTHHHSRVKKPMVKKGAYFREVSWDEALGVAAEALRAASPAEVALLVSPDLSCEGLFAAREFAAAIGTPHLDTSARALLPGGPAAWKAFFSRPISLARIAKCDTILAVGLDTRFHFSIAGVQIRRALAKGARLVALDARDGNLCKYTDHCLRVAPGSEGALLAACAEALEGGKPEVKRAAAAGKVAAGALANALDILAQGQDVAVLVGPQALMSAGAEGIAALQRILGVERAMVVPLYYGANTRGALELGLLDGPEPPLGLAALRKRVAETDAAPPAAAIPRVLYLAGENPVLQRPACDFLIVQDLYLPPYEVDVFLPAASFAEAGGSLISIEGRLQDAAGIETLPDGAINGFSRPDWWIFSNLAARLGAASPRYASREDVLDALACAVEGFPTRPDRRPRVLSAATHAADPSAGARRAARGSTTRLSSAEPRADGYVLVPAPAGFAHRGFDLAAKVAGLAMLDLEESFRMNPDDLKDLGVAPGGRITVAAGGLAVSAAVLGDEECPRGSIYFTKPAACGGLEGRAALAPLWALGDRPVAAAVGTPGP